MLPGLETDLVREPFFDIQPCRSALLPHFPDSDAAVLVSQGAGDFEAGRRGTAVGELEEAGECAGDADGGLAG